MCLVKHWTHTELPVQMGQGVAQWEQSLRACQEGRGSTELLRALCIDLQNSVRLWLDLRLAQSPVSPTVLSHAIRAVQVCNAARSLLGHASGTPPRGTAM